MSESEKAKRDQHEKWRKKWIRIQAVIISIFVVFSLLSFFAFNLIKKATYVPYSENGNVIHRAYLKDNEFYHENYLNGSHAYVSTLIEKLTADFSYNLQMSLDDVNFKYTYYIDAQIEIKDKASNTPIFNPIENILPKTSKTAHGKSLSINELITLDYHSYNQNAHNFVTSYNVKNTINNLIVRMYVDVVGISETFTEESTSKYVIELYIPLLENTVKPSVHTTVPAGVQMIVAKDTGAQNVCMILIIIFTALALLTAIALGVFILLSRNKHIDYSRRVQILVANYKSYIQKILDEYDVTDHQVIRVQEFTELLEIRDTIRQPIFMYENNDKTSTKFFVVTSYKTIYLYEIKVADDEFTNKEVSVLDFVEL